MQLLGKGHGDIVVDTIASWALRYTQSFPQTSGIQNPLPKTKAAWDSVYDAARNLMARQPIRNILQASYSGVYVDEYQDCTIQQHNLVSAIAAVLPTRLLGDPLQGIFDFGQNRPIDWERDVTPNFPELPTLDRPWRWESKNTQLGQWLTTIRQNLLNRRPISLVGAPVRWESIPTVNPIIQQVSVCLEIGRHAPDTVVVFCGMPQQCHYAASRLKGLYQCVEAIETQDLFLGGTKIETTHGPLRAAAVIDFAAKCLTKIGTVLGRVKTVYQSGSIPNTRQGQLSNTYDLLRQVAQDDSYAVIIRALEQISSIPQAVMYRRELFNEMIRGLRAALVEGNGTLSDALWLVRNRTRFTGRRLGRCVVGTTLLVKGLEFDHAIILDADGMDSKDLYVALTRGAKSLTIFSRSQTITSR
jgi:DNA helicase-2/ATP-dependent DNA helicase PcrA